MTGPWSLRSRDVLALAAAIGVALCCAALMAKLSPLIVLAAVGVFVLVVLLGIESLIALAMLGAVGLVPFVKPEQFVTGQVKAYALLFGLGLGAMLAAWAGRELSGKRGWGLPVNAMTIGLIALLAYTLLAGLATEPLQVPAMATPYFVVPLAGLGTILWLSHDEALEGLRKVLPILIVLIVLWALLYDAGAAGCNPCRTAVGTNLVKAGLLGPDSRLYTSGQDSFLALFVLAFGYMLYRPKPMTIGLVGLGALTIALQASRAQYIGILAAIVILAGWKFRQLPSGGRVALIVISGLILLALAISPVGHRTALAYTELQKGNGTGDVRLRVVEETQQRWSLFGIGFSEESLSLSDVDLGLPNTLVVLGYAGALLQLSLLGLGAWRGLRAASLAGAAIAAVMVLVLVSRPTLPLLEYGPSTPMYGLALGFAAAIVVPRRVRATARKRPLTTSSLRLGSLR